MRGDYTRFSFVPRKRYDALLQQQGRMQTDADWNEAAAIARRRTRLLGLDLFGPVWIGADTTPDAFKIAPIVGPPVDLSIAPGRIYVDGVMAELFADETASYLKQPFLPDPPALPAGDIAVYLDIWEREVTWVQDPTALLDAALGGRDTTTRLQTVWQVKTTAQPGATCGLAVGAPPSAGRLSSSAIAPAAPDDPCLLPPVAGYRGLENRLYRVEIHNGGSMGTARFKWSRDNGSIVSAISAIVVAGGQTQLTVSRLGRDAVLGFSIGDWVTVTDDNRELAEEPGEMARIADIQPATTSITLDRALPSAGARPFGANPTEIATRHTRVQRWDQTSTNTLDADGLIATGAALIPLEDGVQVQFSLDPAAGAFRTGDWWVFWARVATAQVEMLEKAPPRGNLHRYVQLAAVTGLGGPSPTPSDCRPGKKSADDCCCTVVVAVGDDIQKAIDSLPGFGGCVCLRAGVHVIPNPLSIARSNVKLEGESPGTRVVLRAGGPVLTIGDPKGAQRVEVVNIDFERGSGTGAVVAVNTARAIFIDRCAARGGGGDVFGFTINDAESIAITGCIIEGTGAGGIYVTGENTQRILLAGNAMPFDHPTSGATVPAIFGILSQFIVGELHVLENAISGVFYGIVANDTPGMEPNSYITTHVTVRNNSVVCLPVGPSMAPVGVYGIDLTASHSTAANNLVRLPEGNDQHVGIRISGFGSSAVGNTVEAGATTGSTPIGIQVGYAGKKSAIPTADVSICNNFVTSCPVGIVALAVDGGSIAGNSLSFGNPDANSVGIGLGGCILLRVEDNQINGFASGVSALQNIGSRVAGNVITGGGLGVFLNQENGAAVADNRITFMAAAGVGGLSLLARTDVVNNRIAGCGLAGNGASAIGVMGSMGILRIAGNEVLDTGVPPSGAAATPVYGIAGALILEASIEGNLVTYSQPDVRVTTAEDRALYMGGMFEYSAGTGDATTVLGYPIQIVGNSFVGTGRTALVELLEGQGSDSLHVRFERVIFCNNYCRHVSLESGAATGGATVKLVGRVANVVANQIKSFSAVPSVDFGGMPGPFVANVISHPPINQSNTPAPDAALNVMI